MNSEQNPKIVDRTLKPEFFEDYQSNDKTKQAGTRDTIARLERYSIIPHLKKDYIALDVGCNEGLISIALAPYVSKITGIDVHKPFIEKAQMNQKNSGYDNCEFICRAFSESDFQPLSFDVILSLAAHFWMEDLEYYINSLV